MGGKSLEALGFRCEEVNEDVDGSSVWWILFSLLMENVPVCQNICTNIFVLCDHDCVVSYTSICFLEVGLLGRTLLLSSSIFFRLLSTSF